MIVAIIKKGFLFKRNPFYRFDLETGFKRLLKASLGVSIVASSAKYMQKASKQVVNA
ncbi:MAG: hypothetical protein ACJA1X_001778 [Bermanella sp.]|jgi:hypothetical protein